MLSFFSKQNDAQLCKRATSLRHAKTTSTLLIPFKRLILCRKVFDHHVVPYRTCDLDFVRETVKLLQPEEM